MANAAPNFASILDEAPTEIERPKPLPTGTYLCVVEDYELGASKKNQTPYVRFSLIPQAALDDVDQDALAEAGGVDGRKFRVDYWLTDDAVYRLDEFHVHCGIDISQPMARKFRNDECKNASVLAFISHTIDEKDPSRVYINVDRTAPAE